MPCLVELAMDKRGLLQVVRCSQERIESFQSQLPEAWPCKVRGSVKGGWIRRGRDGVAVAHHGADRREVGDRTHTHLITLLILIMCYKLLDYLLASKDWIIA
jgi:hypothetical protein